MARPEEPAGAADEAADPIALLVRLTRSRVTPPEDRTARVRAAVHAEWRRSRLRRQRRRLWAVGTLAAGAAAGAMWLPRTAGAPSPHAAGAAANASRPLAAVTRIVGEAATARVRVAGEPRDGALFLGDVLIAGSVLTTGGDSRLALRLGQASVRLDHRTRLTLVSANALELEAGAVYVDSGPKPSLTAELEVRTPLGRVRDQGTQFEVRLSDAALRVRVREGLVELETSRGMDRARPGDELQAREGHVVRRAVALDGEAWRWAADVAPTFALDGASLAEFLDWACRESGWTYRFADASFADAGRREVLHGSIEGLDPSQALDAVLPTVGFTHVLAGHTLVLRREAAEPEAAPSP